MSNRNNRFLFPSVLFFIIELDWVRTPGLLPTADKKIMTVVRALGLEPRRRLCIRQLLYQLSYTRILLYYNAILVHTNPLYIQIQFGHNHSFADYNISHYKSHVQILSCKKYQLALFFLCTDKKTHFQENREH